MEANSCNRPQKIKFLISSVLHYHYGMACADSQPYSFCQNFKDNGEHGAADLNDRPKFFLPSSFSIYSIDLTDDGKLGYGFTSADELEEIDIGPGDKPRPTFVSKRLHPPLREPMITLLKEYADCFAWDYREMPGLDRSIVEHRLPLKSGFRPFQQRARQMKADVLIEVKKEVEKMLEAGFIRACMSDPGPRGCVHQGVRIGLGDRTCPVPYLYCVLPACGVELVDTEGNYSSCTRVRFLS
jgi:hypothetical protein